MKNFRKVLALVLVAAMLFSFTAMSSAAYEDASDISYKEAVDVLSYIGILNGYEVAEDEFEFHPTAEIDRDEMAKMIAVLANAGDDVSELYAVGSKFADVPKAHWAASYVAYCATEGIVDGRSATTFDPDASVTALETAKMLLVVLGFDGAEQGYTGANWKTNVLTDAKLMGLFNGFPSKYNYDSNITRELAAQMMLNALQAPCVVGVLSDGIVKVTNGLIYGGLTVSFPSNDIIKLSAYATLKDAMEAGKWCLYGNVVISNDILYKNLFKGLTKGEGYDCFGRPSTVWTKSGKTIGTYAAVAVEEYTTKATIAADFGIKAADVETVKADLVVNGAYVGRKTVKDIVDNYTGKGVLTQVYGSASDLHVVVINTYITKIAEVNDRKGTATITGYEAFKNTEGFKKNDVVLYKPCNGEAVATLDALVGEALHSVVAAEAQQLTVEETWTNVDKDTEKSWIVAGGDKYEYAFNLGKFIEPDVKPNADGTSKGWVDTHGIVSALADKAKLHFYTDEYGYIIHWGEYTETPVYGYAYLVENTTYGVENNVTNGKLDNATYKFYGDFVNFDAELTEDVQIDEELYKTDADDKYGTLVKYEVKKGVATLVAPVATHTADAIGKDGRLGNQNIWADDATNFLVRTYSYDTGKYTYTAYTGLEELPAGLLSYVYNADADKGTLQYFAKGNRATYVFIDAYYAEAADYFVALERTNEVSVSKFDKLLEAFTCYTALVNGEEAYVFVDSTKVVDNYNIQKFDLMKATVKTLTATFQGKPVYIVTDHVEAASLKEIETLDIKNGTMIINTINNAWRYNEDTQVIVLLKDGNGTAKLADDYIVLNGVKDIESFNGVTGYDYGWYVAFGTTADLNTMYIWVK